jgi:hypothetical protein
VTGNRKGVGVLQSSGIDSQAMFSRDILLLSS